MFDQTFAYGPRQIDIWPKGLEVKTLDNLVRYVRFTDMDEFNNILTERFIRSESEFREKTPPEWSGAGGAKIRDIDGWQSPELALLNERAKTLFRVVCGAPAAHIDDYWGNVYREGEFIGPHAHRRTEASVVYHLLPPDKSVTSRFEGCLGIADPRVNACCSWKSGYVTAQVYPPMEPGTMIIFPGYVTHYVTPHKGDEARISIAWNIDRKPVELDKKDDPLAKRYQSRR